jgi:uncharacterized protein YaeQ
MALQGSVVRFKVELAHVDRQVFQAIDVKMARHPSETERYLLARLLWAGCHSPAMWLSTPDEPALSMHTLDGRLTCWVEIGNPSAERLHKASKASPRVVLFTQHDPTLLRDGLADTHIHKREHIEVFAIAPAFLDALAAHTSDRGAELSLTITEGQLYATVGGATIEGSLQPVSLAPAEQR